MTPIVTLRGMFYDRSRNYEGMAIACLWKRGTCRDSPDSNSLGDIIARAISPDSTEIGRGIEVGGGWLGCVEIMVILEASQPIDIVLFASRTVANGWHKSICNPCAWEVHEDRCNQLYKSSSGHPGFEQLLPPIPSQCGMAPFASLAVSGQLGRHTRRRALGAEG